jgi:hypothetical protein
LLLLVVPASHGQVDTTDAAAPADTIEAPSDTSRARPDTNAVRSDTASAVPQATARPDTGRTDTTNGRSAEQEVPDDPRALPDPVYGRPAIDSLPVLTPHAGIEHALAPVPGSFLYDLGAVGWPHGWSPRGLGPHRSRLWLNGHPYDSPITGRARFDLLPPAFLKQPRVGVDPGGAPVGVHASWRTFDTVRPLTELRFRRDGNGLRAIEVGHSQKYQLSPFGRPGIFQVSFGYGGRTTDGAYNGSDLQRERRLWGRLRYQGERWAVAVSDLSSRHRIGAHSGVVPPEGAPFDNIYVLPTCEDCSVNSGARRNTFRNDLTARVRGPLIPGLSSPTDLSATWTSNTFDFQTGSSGFGTNADGDTTWTVKLNGGHARVQQPLRLGRHALTLGVRGSLWNVARTNVPQVGGTRWAAHAFARDSLRLAGTDLVLDAGWHATSDQQYPSAAAQLERPLGPFRFTAAASVAGQRRSWVETDGFAGLVQPLSDAPTTAVGQVATGRVGLGYTGGAFDLQMEGFAHQIRNALDLYATAPAPGRQVAAVDTVAARRTATPVRRVGGTVSVGWRCDVDRGLYATGSATALTTLNPGASRLHTRLARTLPEVYGQGRIGVRFVFFVDLITDLYVQARGWSRMNSRWFHPPTGRLVVPPATNPVPSRPGFVPGPNGTVDVHAEIKLRGATLFFALENAQVSFAAPGSTERQATLQPGTFTVPVYPLPARQFRFGVHWPIFD